MKQSVHRTRESLSAKRATKSLGGRLMMMVVVAAIALLPSTSHGQETTGNGCYDTSTNQCNCDESVCSETLCSSIGGVWTDGCTSCQCVGDGDNDDDDDDDNAETTTSNNNDTDTSFGCYDLPTAERACTCTSDVCSESTCVEQGGTWTDGCRSCSCDDGDGNDSDENDQEEPTESSGFGCYDLPEAPMQCTCSDEVCEEELCDANNGTWTDRCTSCSCSQESDGGNGGSSEGDGDPNTGWGCYDITVNQCGCAAQFCAQDACEEAGGIFTDGCGTCQCQQTFAPGMAPIQTTSDNGNPTDSEEDDSTAPTPMPTSRPSMEQTLTSDASLLHCCYKCPAMIVTILVLFLK